MEPTKETNPNQSEPKRFGGRQKGAGRPQGSAAKKTREIADKAASQGITPLEYMLRVLRAELPEMPPGVELSAAVIEAHEARRFEAAKAAAPYIHPRLAAVQHTGEGGGPLQIAVSVAFD